MRIVAHRGTRLHAPENTRTALLSAYAAGADVLEFDAQLTKDGRLVVSHDPTLDRLTGQPGKIIDLTLDEILQRDVSATFQPRNSTQFKYFHNAKQKMPIETLPELLDLLPPDIELLLELKHDSSLHTGRRDELVSAAMDCLLDRDLISRVVLYSKDPENLRLARFRAPELRIAAFDYEMPPMQRLELMRSLSAEGLVTALEEVLSPDGTLTEFGVALEKFCDDRELPVGAVLYPQRKPGLFLAEEYDALWPRKFVWSISTDSMLDVRSFVRPGERWIDEAFAARKINTRRWALGYAKANQFAHVYQDDGVHLAIKPYVDPTPPTTDPAELRLRRIEERLVYVEKDWPYYSGGGVGFVAGITGDFSAEVDYTVETVSQATTLEMAVLNVDPGGHQNPWEKDGVTPRLPKSFRDKDSFYDPHGAPPYVGVEHDEDDGYRINWNLGSEYDSNQYGRPVGDGATPHGGRLRLERRGEYFAAYYRNAVDAADWVCVGAVRNGSLNSTVFLRCAGKRWRQEDPDNPSQFLPIVANHITFKNLTITRFPRSST